MLHSEWCLIRYGLRTEFVIEGMPQALPFNVDILQEMGTFQKSVTFLMILPSNLKWVTYFL